MIIAIDYDDTYTRDPNFWDGVIRFGERQGHSFYCVTRRRFPPKHPERLTPCPVICVPVDFKRVGAAAVGVYPDVWIDDMPGFIEPSRILKWD